MGTYTLQMKVLDKAVEIWKRVIEVTDHAGWKYLSGYRPERNAGSLGGIIASKIS